MLMKPSQLGASSPGSRFLRSVHLETDLLDADSLQGYLVTSGTRTVLPRLGLARQASSANRAFTITGPYGTGKSAQSLFAARVLAPPEFPGAAAAQRLLHKADPEMAAAVLRTKKDAPGLLPIAVTGSREPLVTAILRGVEAALDWIKGRRAAPVTARLNAVREKSQAGREPSVSEMLELFGKLLEVACDGSGPFGGVFLIVDELGKLLEHAAGGHGGSDVYLLQALAEFAARTPQPFIVLGVLHRDFAAYADRLSSRDRAEWEKVVGRFETIPFVQPADDALRLIALARTQARSVHREMPVDRLPPAAKRTFGGLCEDAWKRDMAPAGMSKSEFVGLLRDSWPLHPLVTLLLGRLFQKLAENKRSMFAFPESGEPYGLREFLADSGRNSSCRWALQVCRSAWKGSRTEEHPRRARHGTSYPDDLGDQLQIALTGPVEHRNQRRQSGWQDLIPETNSAVVPTARAANSACSGFNSIPTLRRPNSAATRHVVPLPTKGSSTKSPGSLQALIMG